MDSCSVPLLGPAHLAGCGLGLEGQGLLAAPMAGGTCSVWGTSLVPEEHGERVPLLVAATSRPTPGRKSVWPECMRRDKDLMESFP